MKPAHFPYLLVAAGLLERSKYKEEITCNSQLYPKVFLPKPVFQKIQKM